ncbi:hypothetical protein P2Q00_30050 [Streptomyces coacervatus]|uniref:beta-xylosidase family glycoside hydrolase n=1 Tax=Streptomyces coacervatus TaxID=647381 RepID=UPI0023DC779B|nr:hypothetical protein [Streptomyces coacervatus]MDF2269643.1 hypothetical protein [Streptomyces coacervatus]
MDPAHQADRLAAYRPRVPTSLLAVEIPAPDLPAGEPAADGEVDGFDQPTLDPRWSTLRRPATPDWVTLTARPSHLRLHGGRSPQSLVGPSMVARRVPSPDGAFEATIEYRPRSFRHLAGITAYHNTRNWYFLHVTADDEGQAVLRVARCDRGELSVDEADGVPLGEARRLRLGLDLQGAVLRFRHDSGDGWQRIGSPLDATVLSAEHAEEFENGQIRALGFTGAFVGPWAWDLTGGA